MPSPKKQLLFVMESLRIGGAEKSLLTLLSLLDYDRYEVRLLLLEPKGELLGLLPPQVQLLDPDEGYTLFAKSRKLAPLRFLARGDVRRAWHSALYLAGCLGQRLARKPLYIGWEHIAPLFSGPELEADAAIAYLERRPLYFTAQRVKARRKIAFIHNDYSRYPYDAALDARYFPEYDRIATVSEHCRQVLAQLFPQQVDKFLVIRNMVCPELIRQMARTAPEGMAPAGRKVLVTVGRLVEQKGYDQAIEVCAQLVKRGVDLVWYAVGEGPERPALERKIQQAGLSERFILAGAQTNPYAWMGRADVYVQPSRFEGFGITVAEAKVLGLPIVCSDIPEFREQLEGYPACRFASQPRLLAEGILQLLDQPAAPVSVPQQGQPPELSLFLQLLD